MRKQASDSYERRCFRHNEPLDEYFQCSVCKDEEEKERIIQEQEQRLKEEKRAKEIADHPEPLLELIGVGKRHLQCSFDNFQGADKTKEICRKIVNEWCDLVLYGTAGCGKTHMATAIFRELVRKRVIIVEHNYHDEPTWKKNGLVITAPDLLLQIRQVFNGNSKKTEADIVHQYSQVEYLLLDDLGAEKTSEWSISTLYTIIDERYREVRPTIVTTNLTLDEIAKQISPRIASRLSQGKILKLNLPDYRKKRSEETAR